MLKRHSSRAHLNIHSSRLGAGLLAQFILNVVALIVRKSSSLLEKLHHFKNIRATVMPLKNVVKSVVSLRSMV